jgi:uncharacterized Fe-S cluster-containing radical SAM superfamily protein
MKSTKNLLNGVKKMSTVKEYNNHMDTMSSYPENVKADIKKVMKMQVKNSKLGKMAHFSKKCPFKCSYCYGIKAINRYPETKKNIEFNTEMILTNEFPEIPKNRNVFRLFSVYGDFESIEEIKKVIRLAQRQPDKMIYGYTKTWTIDSYIPYLRYLKNMKNVVLRFSVDDSIGSNLPVDFTKAGIVDNGTDTSQKHFICQFGNKESKMYKLTCDKCKICFKKSLQNMPVYFPKH